MFKADPNDHFETSISALADVFPAIAAVKRIFQLRLGKLGNQKPKSINAVSPAVSGNGAPAATTSTSSSDFVIYDPFFCAGKVKEYWQEIFGLENVINENRDFYQDIGMVIVKKEEPEPEPEPVEKEKAEGETKFEVPQGYLEEKPKKKFKLPEVIATKDDVEIDLTDPEVFPFAHYSMCVTNPPFSQDHIPKLFKFLAKARKPYAVLMPDYIVTKKWFKDFYEETYCARATAPSTKVSTSAATASAVQKAVASSTGSLKSLFSNHPAFAAAAAAMTNITTTPATNGNNNNNKKAASAKPQEPASSSAAPNNIPKNISTILQEDGDSAEPFFIFPKRERNYEFEHPLKAGRSQSHFRSCWMVWVGSMKGDVYREVQCPSENIYSGSKNALNAQNDEERNDMMELMKGNPSDCEIFFSLEKFLLRLQKFGANKE